MGITRCCVDGCKSTKKDKLLYNIPTQDELRELWLKFLLPRSPSLANMAKEQLVCRKVCELHFEKKYLAAGNRRKSRLACPTLFSVDEILSGKPATPIKISFKNFQEEHSYNLPIPENTPGQSPHQDRLCQNEDDVLLRLKYINLDHIYSKREKILIKSDLQDANATPSTSGTTSSEVANPIIEGSAPSLPLQTSDQQSSSGTTAAISNNVETYDARSGVPQMGAHSPSSSGATRAPTSTTSTETRSGVPQMGAHSPSSSGATRAPTSTTSTETRSGVPQMGAHSPSSSGATRAPTSTTSTETRSGVPQMGAHSPSSSGATRAPTSTTSTETRSGVPQMGAHSPSSSGATRAPTSTTSTETRSGVPQMGAHSSSSSGATLSGAYFSDPTSGNSVTQSDPTPSARASDRTGSNSDVHTLQASVGQMPSSSGNTDTHNKTTRNRIVRSINNLTPKCKSIYKKCVQIIKSKRRLIYNYSEKLEKAQQLNEKMSFSSMIESLTPQAKTFMHMQINLANKHVKRRRFTTEEKLLALSLAKQSPKGYKLLHKMFILPSRRTLNKFTQKIKFRPGVNKNILSQLKESVKNWDPIKKTCSVVFDEVALSPQLTYVESEDRIDGFVNFGQESEQKFCDHALVFMVRGICASWRQPLAYYLCEGATPAITLKNILKVRLVY